MLEKITKKQKIIIGVISIIVILIMGIYYFVQNKSEDEYFGVSENFENDIQNEEKNKIVEETPKIIVHISGQVVNPGVISLEEGARIIDAINASGGTTKEADLSKVNLAYILADAQKIYIPSKEESKISTYILEESGEGEIITTGSDEKNKKEAGNVKININTASLEELQQLSGIGETIATRIVEYRKQNGKFKTIEDIKNVSGIGESKFSKIKDNIFVK